MACVPSSQAQFLARQIEPQFVADSQFLSVSLACTGNASVASLLYESLSHHEVKILFKLSSDGGHHWRTSDPGLPDQRTSGANRIWKVVMIDSLNIVAIGDTALVLRTTDGGYTWSKQELPIRILKPLDVSFANPTDGILIDASHLFETKDAGQHWALSPYIPHEAASCFAFGNSKFAIFTYGSGKMYTTRDDWNTVDSLGPATEFTPEIQRVLGSCWYAPKGVLIAGGNRLIPVAGGNTRVHPLIYRSSDTGHSWTLVYEDTTAIHGTVYSMSSATSDTIFAGCTFGRAGILRSTDRGRTWVYDSVLFDPPDTTFIPVATWGIGRNASGEFVASMGYFNTALIVGARAIEGVLGYQNIPFYSYLYPNPANESINIVSEARTGSVFVYDLLGRRVLSGSLDNTGKCRLDAAWLPPSTYVVMISSGGYQLPVSRVAVTH
jgi:photosystem II stability/assembly factor-like uncharacterized protein